MWLFTKIGFFSVVNDKRDPNLVHVRGRVRADLEAFLHSYLSVFGTRRQRAGIEKNDVEIIHTPDADYPFRVIVRQVRFASWLEELALEIDYDNFKGSIPVERARVYHDIWDVMRQHFEHERGE